MAEKQQGDSAQQTTHKAGLFDIRVIIGSLIGIYGVILVLTGLIGSDAKVENATTINVWSGLGLIVVSVGFVGWARLRPIVVPVDAAKADATDGDRPAAH